MQRALKSMQISRISQLALLAMLLAACSCSAFGQRRDVEPHVRQAYEAAFARLPAMHQQLLGDVRLQRQTRLAVPDDAPLAHQLLSLAARASYDVNDRIVRVYDAGVEGRSTWDAPPPSRDELAVLMAAVADALHVTAPSDGDDPALESAWDAFVAAVYGWDDEPAPQPSPAMGDAAVLERFINAGVQRAMGGDVDLEGLIVHELGHAIQLHQNQSARIAAWSELSNWTETSSNQRADGYVDGAFAMEEVDVLLRLLLDGDRGDSLFAHGQRAAFVNRYMRYDPREDYAEATRLLADEPGRLAEVAPAKFMFLNSVGFNAAMNVQSPGPLWVNAATIAAAPWREHLVQAAHWYLAGGDEDTPLSASLITAVMRAHAEVLRAEELPRPHGLSSVPLDLPDALRDIYGSTQLAFMIDGVRFSPPREAMIRQWDAAYASWREQRELQFAMDDLLGSDAAALGERIDVVTSLTDSQERYDQFYVVLQHGREELSAEMYQAALEREVTWHRQNSPPWYALQLQLDGFGEIDEQTMQEARQMRSDLAPSFASVQLAEAIVRHVLQSGDQQQARADTTNIPGVTHGAAVRVAYLCQLAHGGPAIQAAALQLATQSAERCPLPQLRQQLFDRIDAFREELDS